MGKIHQVLAVRGDRSKLADRILEETRKTFTDRRAHFTQIRKVKTPVAQEGNQETRDETVEEKPLVETVPDKISYTLDQVSGFIDAVHQVEEGNTQARADVIVDGKIILAAMPATTLLALQNFLEKKLRPVLQAVPTLDPMKGYTPDPSHTRKNVYRASPVTKDQTNKIVDFKVVVPATPEHPAQVKDVVFDKVVARITTQEWCAELTPSEKADLLGRLESIIEAVKDARSRANQNDVPSTKISDKLWACLLNK